MVRIRPDGHLVFMGRYKDMLKVGGENVAPAEIEGRLLELEASPRWRWSATPIPAWARCRWPTWWRPAAPSSVADEVLGSLRGRIASFKVPRHARVVDSLPMTSSGKVRKVELRAHALEELGDPHHS